MIHFWHIFIIVGIIVIIGLFVHTYINIGLDIMNFIDCPDKIARNLRKKGLVKSSKVEGG